MTRGQQGVADAQPQPGPPAAPLTYSRRIDDRGRRLRLALLIGWLLLAAASVGLGERPTSFHELEASVASGEVHEVTVVGPSLSANTRGSVTVEVHWRDGLVRHVATVIEAQPRRAAPHRDNRGDATAVITGKVEDRLTASQPGLLVRHADVAAPTMELLDLQVPWWTGWAALALGLVTLGLLITGPEPRRATRWAWFWLLGVGFPIGMIAFLLLSGPLGPSTAVASRAPARRLTGGWAFLLALVLSNVLRTTGA